MEQSLRALIVEDNAAWQKRLRRHLQRQGLAADVAGNLTETRHFLETATYDLVTVDINLDETDPHNQDGLEVLKMLGEMGITAIVIRASGEESQQASRQAIEQTYHPFAYLLKYQYSYADFRATVQQALTRQAG